MSRLDANRPVLMLANADSPHTAQWCDALAGAGYRVHVLTVHGSSEVGEKVIVHRLSEAGTTRRRTSAYKYLAAIPAARKLLREVRPCVVHSQYATGYGLLGTALRFHPTVVSVWGTDVLTFPKRSPVHRAMVSQVLGHADLVCSTSRFMAARTAQYTAQPITVTPFGVDCQRFRKPTSASNHDRFTVGMVKLLRPGAGVSTLLRALRRLHEGDCPPIRAIFVGGGAVERYRREAASMGIVADFVGPVPHEQVPILLSRMDVLVMPSHHEESFGVAALEAQASGLPVVASRIGGIPEVVRDGVTGFLTQPGNDQGLAIAIHRLATDIATRRSMGTAARDFVSSNFSIEKTRTTMVAAFQQVQD